MVEWYKGSKTNRLLCLLRKNIPRYREHSVIVKFMERLDKYTRASFNQSGFLDNLRNIFQTASNFMMKNIAGSRIINAVAEITRSPSGNPLQNYGVALTAIIITNAFLSLCLHKPITPFGWAIRAMFLICGLLFLSCRKTWRELRKDSFLLRFWIS